MPVETRETDTPTPLLSNSRPHGYFLPPPQLSLALKAQDGGSSISAIEHDNHTPDSQRKRKELLTVYTRAPYLSCPIYTRTRARTCMYKHSHSRVKIHSHSHCKIQNQTRPNYYLTYILLFVSLKRKLRKWWISPTSQLFYWTTPVTLMLSSSQMAPEVTLPCTLVVLENRVIFNREYSYSWVQEMGQICAWLISCSVVLL